MKLLTLILLFTMLSCSPVRNRYMTRSGSDGDSDTSRLSSIARNSDNRLASPGVSQENKDTMYIKLPPIYVNESLENKKRTLNAELDSAIYMFNQGKYDVACEQFNLLQETLKENDSLYNETVFYSAECLIVHNEYKLANRLLNGIMDKKLSSNLKERVLLRQGHLLCALGDENTAQWYFDKLVSEYPKSIYTKLANCNSLK